MVKFFRFPKHISIAGTPNRPPRSLDRIRRVSVIAPSLYKDHIYTGAAEYADVEGLKKCDVIVIAMPAYMYERLGALLPGVFSGKPVVSLCERFFNTAALLTGIRAALQREPSLLISHRSEPIDATKPSKDGICTLWRVKETSSVVASLGEQNDALVLLKEIWGFSDTAFKFEEDICAIAFQNLNAIGHAALDIRALRFGLFEQGREHYTRKTYTSEITARINAISFESNAIAKAVTNFDYPSLAAHEVKSYDGNLLVDCAGTPEFRFENHLIRYRFAPEPYRASGYEDVGWSLVPLERLGRFLGLNVANITTLIDEWNQFARIDYRIFGRDLCMLLPFLPANIQMTIRMRIAHKTPRGSLAPRLGAASYVPSS